MASYKKCVTDTVFIRLNISSAPHKNYLSEAIFRRDLIFCWGQTEIRKYYNNKKCLKTKRVSEQFDQEHGKRT